MNIQYQTTAANYYNNFNTTLFGHQDDQTENNISLNYQHQQQQSDPMLNPVINPLLFLTEEFLGGLKFKSESENQSVEETVKSESADEGFGDYLIHSDLEGTLVATSELDDILYTPIEYKVESSQSPQSDTMSLKSEPQTFDLIEYIAGNVSCLITIRNDLGFLIIYLIYRLLNSQQHRWLKDHVQPLMNSNNKYSKLLTKNQNIKFNYQRFINNHQLLHQPQHLLQHHQVDHIDLNDDCHQSVVTMMTAMKII